jgi:hypothetical protein
VLPSRKGAWESADRGPEVMPDERPRGDLAHAGSARIALGALLALGVWLCAASHGAVAQPADAPRIRVAPTILAEPATQTPISIQIGPSDALPSNSFVRLRGLPPSVSLTEGHAIAPGSWAVPLFGLPTLKANVPAGVSGRSEVTVSLVGVDGTLLAEARIALIVGPAAMIAPAERAAEEPAQKRSTFAPPPPAPKADRGAPALPRPPELSAQDKARAERLLAQGEKHLSDGKVEAARGFFQRAADTGLAAGAVRLAATYDPAELARLQVQGVVPDRALARKWYERARELGAPEAEERLARLAGGS